ncbi:Predicted phosphoribosyltransferases [anaerobic digester metagenome]|jgi:putative phosphoribosyl transferase|uniref:Predicted phosphoribosyltransferases n=1 Tax=anaerobic digester metagenome TaxID=1263854 RepID=A0A485M2T2_9ZZZZ
MEFRYKRLCRLGMNVHKQAGGAFLILSVRGGNVFKDRVDAGRRLAGKLVPYSEGEGIVLAIPRGGVVVGYEIARRLGYLMDLIIPRKIGSPHNSEVAIGAVTQDGTCIVDHRLVNLLGVTRTELEEKKNDEVREIKRRMNLYGAGRMLRRFQGGQLILVDDGVATGHTMLAALRTARNYQPEELIVAVPVAPRDTLETLKKEADRVVCLLVPECFYAVGQYYEEFDQVEDFEVGEILRELQEQGV